MENIFSRKSQSIQEPSFFYLFPAPRRKVVGDRSFCREFGFHLSGRSDSRDEHMLENALWISMRTVRNCPESFRAT